MLNRRRIILEERLSSVIAKNVACYVTAEELERAGKGEEATLVREKSDRWFRLQQKIGAALQASREAA